ncbi:hypothetical protein G7Y89_g8090 [Cudoniella acicularis]|uniref:Uncharacterized protein n=1 Tax=Cudoniella acicularis TaxID=354080 RepID=A0A8H4RHA1_9HELO|nr:hypothetical protein G7Y89_g8090 [Cudoniella acicularis]
MSPNDGVYGPGSFVDEAFTPVPEECQRLLKFLASKTPGFTTDATLLDRVHFEGSDLPCIPGPIKSQAVTAVLHAMAGIVGLEILALKGIKTDTKISIYTDQASMYCNEPGLVTVDGVDGPAVLKNPQMRNYHQHALGSPIRMVSQCISPTKTPNVWFQIHGSTDPDPLLNALGVDPDTIVASNADAYEYIKSHIENSFTAPDMELLMMEMGLPGSIVYSPEGWLKTTMGKALARHPLINYQQQTQCPKLDLVPFPVMEDKRPLAGIKVLELCRIIAAPACGAVLASMGATVIRIQSSHLTDFSPAQFCLMAGKKAYEVDLRDAGSLEKIIKLVEEADVILQGYRLKSLERKGLGLNTILQIANKRGKGIIYLDENCYGPDGYYAERPGWQQIADAAAGSSYVVGRSYGFPLGQGVLPSLPISDMSTGIVSAVNIMMMLRDRAKFGGSWHGTAALTAYNAFTLIKEVGLYQPEIVAKIQEKYKFEPMGSGDTVIPLYYMIAASWKKNSDLITNEKYYQHFKDSVYGEDLRIVCPLVSLEMVEELALSRSDELDVVNTITISAVRRRKRVVWVNILWLLSLDIEESCSTTATWQLKGNYGGCCTTTASVSGCAVLTACSAGSIRVASTAAYDCPATASICITDIILNQLGGKSTTVMIGCNTVSTGTTYYITPPTLSAVSTKPSTPPTTSQTTTATSSPKATSTSSTSSVTVISVPTTSKQISTSPTAVVVVTSSSSPTPTPSPGASKTLIIAAAVGGLAGLGLLAAIVALIFSQRKKRARNRAYQGGPSPNTAYQPAPQGPPGPPQQPMYMAPLPPQQPPPQGYYDPTPSPLYGDSGSKGVVYAPVPEKPYGQEVEATVMAPRYGAAELGYGNN